MSATKTPDSTDRSLQPRDTSTRAAGSLLRVRLGASLQQHRLRCGLTQSQVSEFAGLSLKYVGEIERGEANTTLDALERLADAVGWDPMDALDSTREPITEGVRLLLIAEARQMFGRLDSMVTWLEALDPARHPEARLRPVGAAPECLRAKGRRSRTTLAGK